MPWKMGYRSQRVRCWRCNGPIPEGGIGRHYRRYCSIECRDAIPDEPTVFESVRDEVIDLDWDDWNPS